MKLCFAFLAILAFASFASADSITLKDGDRLTGTITGADAKQITIKTEYAGDVKVLWSDVQDLSSTNPLYVETPQHATASGPLTISGTDLVVHAASGEVRVPIAEVTTVRSVADQQAYERTLHPSLITEWKGGFNLGFALARGNSDTTNLSTAFSAVRKTLNDQIKLYESSIYTTNGVTTTGSAGGVTADEILGGARYDHNLTTRVFAFASGDFTHDVLQHLDLQQIYTGGLGWHAVARPNSTLDLLAGVNYTRESYSAGFGTASVGRNLPGLTFGEDYTHKFNASNNFTETFTFYPDLSDLSQYTFALNAALVTKINGWLGWQWSIGDHYITNPPILGTKSNDLVLSTGLNISFSH